MSDLKTPIQEVNSATLESATTRAEFLASEYSSVSLEQARDTWVDLINIGITVMPKKVFKQSNSLVSDAIDTTGSWFDRAYATNLIAKALQNTDLAKQLTDVTELSNSVRKSRYANLSENDFLYPSRMQARYFQMSWNQLPSQSRFDYLSSSLFTKFIDELENENFTLSPDDIDIVISKVALFLDLFHDEIRDAHIVSILCFKLNPGRLKEALPEVSSLDDRLIQTIEYAIRSYGLAIIGNTMQLLVHRFMTVLEKGESYQSNQRVVPLRAKQQFDYLYEQASEQLGSQEVDRRIDEVLRNEDYANLDDPKARFLALNHLYANDDDLDYNVINLISQKLHGIPEWFLNQMSKSREFFKLALGLGQDNFKGE